MKKKKLQIILKNLKKIIKPHQIVILIILLAGNTYAWFVYSNRVSNSIDVHVRAWNVLFQSGETAISDYFYINVPNAYPGMTNYVNTLTIENESEVAANITYKILEARIFDEEYVTEEGRTDSGEQIQQSDLTSAELETLLSTNYPFTITFSLTSDTMSAVANNVASRSYYSVTVSWPYESGSDSLDTYWGKKAYTYASTYASMSSMQGSPVGISLRVKIFVNQSI